jgi:spermidine synthase
VGGALYRPPLRVAHFAVTIFLSAFLLFQVQPLIGKIILPWFGGTPAVWTTCMLFFQVLLLGGYAYAHALIRRFPPRQQGLVHTAVLVAAVAVTAPTILPSSRFAPEGGESPLLLILALLATSVGLPYFALSATGSLVQAWFARRHPTRSPYPLYALSNAGSLLGLLTFPFLVEPRLGSGRQASAWFWGYALFAFLCAALALRLGWARIESTAPAPPSSVASSAAPTVRRRISWVALAATGSTMLLAITNQMAIDVASVPFLWVVPLSIYLLSFILCFSDRTRYLRVVFLPLLVVALAATSALMLAGPGVELEIQVGVYCTSLFVFVMVCHGELYRLRPDPAHLTSFYLWLSFGGAAGGIFVGLVGPTWFDQYYEMHIALLAIAALAVTSFLRDPWLEVRGGRLVAVALGGTTLVVAGIVAAAVLDPVAFGWVHSLVAATLVACAFALVWAFGTRRSSAEPPQLEGRWRHGALVLPLAAMGLLGHGLIEDLRYRTEDAVTVSRGFFGMLRVVDRELDDPREAQRVLYHGAIKHGFQYLADERQMWHTSYFAPESGVGLAFTRHPARVQGRPMKVGLLGLGAGTLLTYGQPGDRIRIYEIDPDVERLSRAYFTYFDRTQAATEVVIGDGRLTLEREADQGYDLLILDAFSSDAIPMHLLTREAFDTYVRHLAPGGVLAANLSNRHVDIKPVVKQLAEERGREFVWVSTERDDPRGVYGADWGLVVGDRALLDDPVVRRHMADTSEIDTSLRRWTDDYTNLLAVLDWFEGDE